MSKTNTRSNRKCKIAYIHTMGYPSKEANALQAIRTASSFSEIADTTFFIPGKKISTTELKQHYGIPDSPLRIQSMYMNRVISKFRIPYSRLVLFYLRFHPDWAGFQGKKILFIRKPEELLYWGLLRKRQKWLKDWVFIFETHTLLGLDPNLFRNTKHLALNKETDAQHRQVFLQALQNFDLVISVSQGLSDALQSWTNKAIRPHVIRHASPLSRTSEPSKNHSFGNKITLGYIGTIDHYRGVNIILEAMRYLPPKFNLRLVGRVAQEDGVDPEWLKKYTRDPLIESRVELVDAVPIHGVADEIDRCDIVIQPASNDIIGSQYASPLKSYDYMVRGKPIIVADVPCHHELFKDEINGIFYRVNSPQHLADRILFLVSNPDLVEKIARLGWEQSRDYTYPRRADAILSLVNLL
jgi:glycosyltransferase involved in cell wall biosynthesis